MAPKKEEEVKQRIRIKIQAYDHKLIDQSIKQIVEAIERYDAEIRGPIPLPTQIHKYIFVTDTEALTSDFVLLPYRHFLGNPIGA